MHSHRAAGRFSLGEIAKCPSATLSDSCALKSQVPHAMTESRAAPLEAGDHAFERTLDEAAVSRKIHEVRARPEHCEHLRGIGLPVRRESQHAARLHAARDECNE